MPKWKDKMNGGYADKRSPKDFDKKQLAIGIKVEMEHTKDKHTATEIAMDHLEEDPKYYKKLKAAHLESVSYADRLAENIYMSCLSD